MKQETMSIRCFILKKRTLMNGEAPIILRVTIDGDYEEARIQRSIPVELWNQAIGMSSGKERKDRELNDYIRTLHTRLNEIHKEMLLSGALITPAILLKKLFCQEEQVTVLGFYREHNDESRNTDIYGDILQIIISYLNLLRKPRNCNFTFVIA